VEEVARLAGYDEIPSLLPTAPAGHGLTTAHLVVHVADDAPALRTSLLDTLLDTARRNVSRGAEGLGVFEIGLVTRPDGLVAGEAPGVDRRPTADELAALHAAVPAQPRHVAGVLAGPRVPDGVWGPGRPSDWADAVEAARVVAGTVGVDLTVRAGTQEPWHPGRCAELVVRGADGERLVGHAGELHPKACEALELPPRTVAFELDLDAVLAASPAEPVQVAPVSTFPPAKEDVALVVDAGVPAADVLAAVREGAGELAEEVRLFDVFTGEQLGAGKKSLAFSLRLRAADRTLTAEDTAAVRNRIVKVAGKRVGAVLRS
jgi:phenylalanyl-tRNA synthetase beta chain